MTLAFMVGVGACVPADLPDAPRAGDPFPLMEHDLDVGGFLLFWTFRTSDCLECVQFERDVRQLMRRRPELARLVGLHVGDADREPYLERYFTSKRLRPAIVHVEPAAFRAAFGRVDTPRLFLAHDGRVVESWPNRPVDLESRLLSAADSVRRAQPL